MTKKPLKRQNETGFLVLSANKSRALLVSLIGLSAIAQSQFATAQNYYPPAPQPYGSQYQQPAQGYNNGYYPPEEDPYYQPPAQQQYPQQYQNVPRPQYRPQPTPRPAIDPNTTASIDGPSNYRPSNYPNGNSEQTYTPHNVPQSVYGGLPDADTPAIEMPKGAQGKRQIASLQVLMSRIGASSGVIDGAPGSNFDKAAAAASQLTGKFIDPNNGPAIEAALQATGGAAFTTYTITNEDVGQFYVASIPNDYALKAQLPSMAYTSVLEMLSERFHIDERYLQELNPGVNFRQPGVVINVPNLLLPKRKAVAFIIADKARKQVRGYDEAGKLVVAYPSTIGSSDNPSPSGTVEVKRIALNPNYTYNPKINFKQGENNKVLTIPPGPNGPVGTVWIALSKPTYGIHGTPDPSRIGKTSSHGCIRLTNWDAQELAKLIKPGVVVQFVD
ncbi:L,D-transpeptidase [Bartonella sp. HY038]|uniref:L,D-transpeptidase n=1 Tax=Bartonella sp. HY038 TaxID=2759660 RepID=UPI0015FC23AF|nr:L,D-transpeptidase [Bartonella sp. HY038]